MRSGEARLLGTFREAISRQAERDNMETWEMALLRRLHEQWQYLANFDKTSRPFIFDVSERLQAKVICDVHP